jgi:hypothetical protein
VESVPWGTPIVWTESVGGYSSTGLSSDPDGLSIPQEVAEEMLVLCLIPGLGT